MSSTDYQPYVMPTYPKTLGERLCTILGLDYHVSPMSQEIVGKIDSNGLLRDRSPLTITACSIYMASHILGQPRTILQISDVAGVSNGAIRNAYSIIYPERESLIEPSWYAGGENSRRYQPPSPDREMSISNESPTVREYIPNYEPSPLEREISIFDSPMAQEYISNSSGDRYELEMDEYTLSFPSVGDDFTLISLNEEIDASAEGLRPSTPVIPGSPVAEEATASAHGSRRPEPDAFPSVTDFNPDGYTEPEPFMANATRYLRQLETVPIVYLAADCQTCNICHDEYLTGTSAEEAVRLSPCGHVFGWSCLQNWLSVQGKTTCPMCRKVLYENDMPQEQEQIEEDYGVWDPARFLSIIEEVNRHAQTSGLSPTNRRAVTASNEEGSVRGNVNSLTEEQAAYSYSAQVLDLFRLFIHGTGPDPVPIATSLAAQMGQLYLHLRETLPEMGMPAVWRERGPPVSFLLDPAAIPLIEMALMHMVGCERLSATGWVSGND